MDAVRLRAKFDRVWRSLDERARRLMAAQEAIAWGYGGISAVRRACRRRLSTTTIRRGIAEIRAGASIEGGRVRRTGGGRKSLTVADPDLLAALNRFVSPGLDSPLCWICESTRMLEAELRSQGHAVSSVTLAQLLRDQHFTLQRNRRTEEVGDDSIRVAQFGRISHMVKRALAAGRPVISVETKRSVRADSGAGGLRRAQRGKQAVRVRRALPFGIYDIRDNAEVVVDTDSDTGAFAVASIRGWWQAEGRHLYPQAHELLITADTGGGARDQLWTIELQCLADSTGLTVTACHFPRGTRKWNNVEHPLFSFVSSNYRKGPARNDETLVNLIARTTTATVLTVMCRLDRRKYLGPGVTSDREIGAVNLEHDLFQPNWNYRILPTSATTPS